MATVGDVGHHHGDWHCHPLHAARGDYLGFTALPPLYWPLLAISMLCYVALSQLVKIWLLRKKWI
jgi:hypothetical protein